MCALVQCILVVALWASAVVAQGAIPPPEHDPFVGEWKANSEKSRPKLNKKEATYERIIQRDSDDLIFASSGGTSKERIRSFALRCNGNFYPLPSGPMLACRYVAANRVEGETVDPNGEHHYWTREVSADGTELTLWGSKTRTERNSVRR